MKAIFAVLFTVVLSTGFIPTTFAEEGGLDQEVEKMEKSPKNSVEFMAHLKKQFSLTDDEAKRLSESGLSQPQMAMSSALARASKRPIDEILKMRLEEKKGWGGIAKELNVKPREIGRSVRQMHQELKGNSAVRERAQARREERQAIRQERRQIRRERQEIKNGIKPDHAGQSGH